MRTFILLITLLLTVHIGTSQNNFPICNSNNCQVCTYTNFCGLCKQGYIINVPLQFGQPQCNQVLCGVDNCKYCVKTNICQSCLNGLVPDVYGQCVSSNKNNFLCQGIAYCLTCASVNGIATCIRCMSGYILLQGNTCAPASVLGNQCQIPGNALGTCDLCYSPTQNLVMSPTFQCQVYQPGLTCPQGCLQCTSTTTCTSCSSGYVLNTINQCIASTVINCQTYSSTGLCTACIAGYAVVNNACVQAAYGCAVQNCQLCNGPNSCYTCSTGYVSYNTGQFTICLTPQQITTIYSPLLTIQNCQTYTNPTLASNYIQIPPKQKQLYSPACSQCSTGMILIGGVCLPQIGTFTCNILYCITCIANNYCGVCNSGSRVVGGVCMWVVSPVQGCLISGVASNGVVNCQLCQPTFININQLCYPKPTVTSCQIQNCQYCITNNTCTQCVPGYQLQTNPTTQITTCTSTCSDPNCYSCSSYTTCTTCNLGYNLNTTTTTCISNSIYCPQIYGSGCLECDMFGCVGCGAGYVLENGVCCVSQNVNIYGCIKASACYNYCLQCYPGYFKIVQGKCISLPCLNIQNCAYCFQSATCIVCQIGYVLDPQQNICISNTAYQSCRTAQNPYCTSCTGSTCLSCDPGTSLVGGQCYCNIPGCLRCLNDYMCLQCAYPLFPNLVEGGGCVPRPHANTVCEVANCNYCNQPTLCSLCSEGYSLNSNNDCTINNCNSIIGCSLCNPTQTICFACSSQYTLTTVQRKCISIPKPYNCNVINCALCADGNQNQCEQCLQGYTLNYLISQCTRNACPQNCLYCLESSVCIICNQGSYLNSNYFCKSTELVPWYICSQPKCAQCIDNTKCRTCLPGYQPNSQGICQVQNCQAANCKICLPTASSNMCMVCQQGFYLNSYQQCMPYIPGVMTPSCPVSNCLYCFQNNKCSVCFPGYEVQEGMCVLKSGCVDPNCNFCLSPSVCAICKNGFTVSKGGCTNLSLILGITIPIGVIVLGVCIYFLYKKVIKPKQQLPLMEKNQKTEKTELSDRSRPSNHSERVADIELNEGISGKKYYDNSLINNGNL